VVVNCAGQWAKAVGAMAGVTVPLHSAEHFYVVTEQIDGVHRDFPILRDPDGYTYIKEEVGGLVSAASSPTPSRGSRRTRCPTRSSSSCWRRTGTTSRS
jgi:Glycine/D-amino acid oxidases (deaminating)